VGQFSTGGVVSFTPAPALTTAAPACYTCVLHQREPAHGVGVYEDGHSEPNRRGGRARPRNVPSVSKKSPGRNPSRCTVPRPGAASPESAGKPVTQEELAEGLGITREWYARIELGIHERVPPPLLTRLAELLMLDRSEREALFALAIPELRWGQLRPDSTSVLQLASLRPILRRLWAASSETEIFANVLEFTQSIFQRRIMSITAVGSVLVNGTCRWDLDRRMHSADSRVFLNSFLN